MKKQIKQSGNDYEMFKDGHFNTNIPDEFNFLLGYVVPRKHMSMVPLNKTIRPIGMLRYVD
jgi:hypothetical protein